MISEMDNSLLCKISGIPSLHNEESRMSVWKHTQDLFQKYAKYKFATNNHPGKAELRALIQNLTSFSLEPKLLGILDGPLIKSFSILLIIFFRVFSSRIVCTQYLVRPSSIGIRLP